MSEPMWRLAVSLLFVACGGMEFSSTGGSAGENPGSAGNHPAGGGGGSLQAGGGGGAMTTGGKSGSAGQPSSKGGAAGGEALGGAGGDDVVVPVNECPCAAPTPTCEGGQCVVRGPELVQVGQFY